MIEMGQGQQEKTPYTFWYVGGDVQSPEQVPVTEPDQEPEEGVVNPYGTDTVDAKDDDDSGENTDD